MLRGYKQLYPRTEPTPRFRNSIFWFVWFLPLVFFFAVLVVFVALEKQISSCVVTPRKPCLSLSPNHHGRKQSSKEPLTITGTGFKGEPVLNFEPAIWADKNYTVTVVSEAELKLELVDGSMWSKYAGALMVKGINVGDGDVRGVRGDVILFRWLSSKFIFCCFCCVER